MRIGYLGPSGSHSHSAALAFADHCMGEAGLDLLVPMMSLRHLLEAVEDRSLSLACVPVENALEGSVNEVLDFMAFDLQNTYIVAEFVRPIQHALIRKYEFIEGITCIHSHPQAIGQCRDALYDLLGHDVKFVPAASTSEAVKALLVMDESHAALGSVEAASHYGMEVLIEDVGKLRHNATRFLMLTGESHPEVAETIFSAFNAVYKTALCLGLKNNQPGALLEILSTLAQNRLNMSKIESRPTKQSLGEYLFYVDIEGQVPPDVTERLKQQTRLYKCLGTYPVLGTLL